METTKVQFDKNSQVRKGRRMKIFLVVILLMLAALVGLVAFLRKPAFQIKEINVTGTKSLDPDAVQGIGQKYITGNYALFIPRSNSLLFSKSGMANFLAENIPSLESANVTFSERNIVDITVTEKKPEYVWCGDEDCYFVDQNGVLYEASPKFSPGVFVIFKGASASLVSTPLGENPLGKRFASAEEFSLMAEILADLENFPAHVLGVEYLSNVNPLAGGEPVNVGDIAITVDQIKDRVVNANARIIITKDQTAGSVIKSLTLLANDKNFSASLSANGDTLNYIDLRFPGKIYYKFGTATPVTPANPAPKKP